MITRKTGVTHKKAGASVAFAAALLLMSTMTGQPAAAQARGEVTVDVERCLQIESQDARQDCFAAEVDQVLQQREAEESEPAAADSESSARRRDRRQQTELAAEESAPPTQVRTAEPTDFDGEEFFGTVVELREYKPSAYILRLDNGQIWQQTEPKQYPLRVGLEVRIYPTRWGNNYRLTGLDSGGRHIQVRQVQ